MNLNDNKELARFIRECDTQQFGNKVRVTHKPTGLSVEGPESQRGLVVKQLRVSVAETTGKAIS